MKVKMWNWLIIEMILKELFVKIYDLIVFDYSDIIYKGGLI